VRGDTIVAVGAEVVSRDADDYGIYGGVVLRTVNGGANWTTTFTPGTNVQLSAVWGASANDLYAVGTGGTLLHYTGTGWVQMTSGVSGALFDVAGSSPRDAFAVGAGGVVVRGRR
jgi:hypothetical protein